MSLLDSFFAWHIEPGMLLYGSYDPWLVTLSIAVAIFSSTMGLQAAYQAGNTQDSTVRRITLLAGAAALGGGVWAMHFIGMLAFRLCTNVGYDAGITILSFAPSMAASWVALDLMSRDKVTHSQLLTSGVLVGAGIGAMHYLGMTAMQMSAALRYDPWTFALSIVVAVGLAVLALWVRFGLKASMLGRTSDLVQSFVGGTVMGLAVAGMHFTGMAAARFIGKPQSPGSLSLHDPVPLALSITLVTMVATVLVAAATGLSRYRQLLERLQTKEARLRAISNTTLDGIVVFDGLGIIREFNPGAQRIYGWQADEIIGHSVSKLMPEPRRTEATRDFKSYLQQLQAFMNVERDTEGQHRYGYQIPIQLVISRMPITGQDLYVAFISDITERVRMAKDLKESEAQFRSLIANIPGISFRCRLGHGWPMVFMSDAVEQITGYPASDFLGPEPVVRIASMVAESDVAIVRQTVLSAISNDTPFVIEFQLQDRHGATRWMWGHGSIVRAHDGQIMWIDGVLLDITERRQMEEDLRQAKEVAEAAATARSTFLANMSHEIRTPMNAIIGFTDVVLSGQLPNEQRKHLETVHKSAKALLHLLNDILDTSKLERGAVEIESLDFALGDLVQQLCAEQSIQARKKDLTLSGHVDASVGEHVKGDPHRLRQILLNLVGNAIKFTHQGGVTVTVTREEEGVHFRVADTGIGIAADRLPHVFEAFTQADASMSRRFGGTGLGTTISKQLVELMHGRIWAESELGEGSVFHVLIPMAPGQASQALNLNHSASGMRLPPMRVLVVDDVTENLDLLSLLLGKQGHTVLRASDGQQALDCLATQTVDVVLMDVQMPVMDGLTACRHIRQREAEREQARTPVLALSASVLQEDRQAAIEAGMDGFATKPVDLDALMAEMARITSTQLIPAEATRGPAAQLQADPAVLNIERGLKLWQDLSPYMQALQRFATAKTNWLQLPQHQQAPEPVTAAFEEAHRLKGVAANLGLLGLERSALAVEVAARSTPAGDVGTAWAGLRQAVSTAVAAVQQLDARPVAASADSPSTLSSEELAGLHRHLAQLREAFKRGECLDKLVTQVCQQVQTLLPASEVTALNQAIDDFDFDAAATCVERMAQGLPQPERLDAAL